jgi:hypothetical protein
MTRDEIIKAAYRKLGVIRATQTPNAQLITDGAQALNAMVKHWQGRGIHIWTTEEATLFPQAGQVQYALSNAVGSDHATASYVATEIATAAVDGAGSIVVDSASGISSGDFIGVVVDDGTVHWTTVNGAPAGATITLTDALDDSAGIDNKVYAYTSKIVRPLKIVDARWVDAVTGDESPHISMIARLDYRRLPTKTQAGSVVSAFYDPSITTGQLYLWHVPNPFEGFVNFTWHRPIQDFDAAGDNPDLPQEWCQAILFNLAVVLAPEFDVPTQKLAQIAAMAATFLDDMEGWDRENESVEFSVDMGP